MAHKKGGGSTRNGRDSQAKRLGVKVFGNAMINAGGIIVADYFMDTDGDGIGDKLQPSRYLVKNSVAELTALGGDVRTDRVYVETSFAAIDDCTGDC